jgi:hypothetical protein
MSYKRAWLLLDSMNQAFTEPVVSAAPGGAGGGGATLTAFGAEVLERYNRIPDHAATTAAEDLTAFALWVTGWIECLMQSKSPAEPGAARGMRQHRIAHRRADAPRRP